MQWKEANVGDAIPGKVPWTPGCKTTMLALTAGLTVSGQVLYDLGIHTGDPAAPIYSRFHPTLVLATIAAVQFFRRRGVGDPEYSGQGVRYFLVAMGLLLVSLAFSCVYGGMSGSAATVNSFVPAMLMAFILQNSRDEERAAFAKLVMYLVTFNAAMCVGENVFEIQLIPVHFGDTLAVAEPGEFRGFALYDHPLDGAMMTMIGIFVTLATQRDGLRTRVCLGIMFLGLIAFGGRTALFVTTPILIVASIGYGLREVLLKPAKLQTILQVSAAAVLIPASMLSVFFLTNIGQRILNRLYFDDSSEARLAIFKFLPQMTSHDVFYGIPFDRLAKMVWQVGLDIPFGDIENFWILELVNMGAIAYVFWLVSFGTILLWGYRTANGWGKVLLVSVVLVASSSNSIARKSNVLNALFPTVIATMAGKRRLEETVEPTLGGPVERSSETRIEWGAGRSPRNWGIRNEESI